MVAPASHPAARRLACFVPVAFGALTLLAGSADATDRPPTDAPTVFIVTCRCATVADRERVADAVRRRGGSVVYMYDIMPGLAVASPRGADASRFMARLRRLPRVTDVQVSGTRQLQSIAG